MCFSVSAFAQQIDILGAKTPIDDYLAIKALFENDANIQVKKLFKFPMKDAPHINMTLLFKTKTQSLH